MGNDWTVSYHVTHSVLIFQIISLKPLPLSCFSLSLCQENLPAEDNLLGCVESLVPRTDDGHLVLELFTYEIFREWLNLLNLSLPTCNRGLTLQDCC